jgi:hypothetical protein
VSSSYRRRLSDSADVASTSSRSRPGSAASATRSCAYTAKPIPDFGSLQRSFQEQLASAKEANRRTATQPTVCTPPLADD